MRLPTCSDNYVHHSDPFSPSPLSSIVYGSIDGKRTIFRQTRGGMSTPTVKIYSVVWYGCVCSILALPRPFRLPRTVTTARDATLNLPIRESRTRWARLYRISSPESVRPCTPPPLISLPALPHRHIYKNLSLPHSHDLGISSLVVVVSRASNLPID